MIINFKDAMNFFTQRYINLKNNKKCEGVILLDMDEVMADLICDWVSVYNQVFNDTLTPNDFKIWETDQVVKPECGKFMFELLKTPGLFRNLQVRQYAQEVVQNLINNGFEVMVVSDSPPGYSYQEDIKDTILYNNLTSMQKRIVNDLFECGKGNPADDKRQWLQEHFPMIDSKNIIFTSQKWFVFGDVIIDDKPSTYQIFKDFNRNILLMDQPYNRFIQTKDRVANLKDAEERIYKMFNYQFV